MHRKHVPGVNGFPNKQMYQLWDAEVDGGNGKEMYGDDFADIWAINRLHFKAAMNKTCDHVSAWFSLEVVHSRSWRALVNNKSQQYEVGSGVHGSLFFTLEGHGRTT